MAESQFNKGVKWSTIHRLTTKYSLETSEQNGIV